MYSVSVEQWCWHVENEAAELQINLRLNLHLAMSQALGSD